MDLSPAWLHAQEIAEPGHEGPLQRLWVPAEEAHAEEFEAGPRSDFRREVLRPGIPHHATVEGVIPERFLVSAPPEPTFEHTVRGRHPSVDVSLADLGRGRNGNV